MKITVTKEDIEKGQRDSVSRCPITRAFKRKTRQKNVRTEYAEIFVTDNYFKLPKRARKFIKDFDNNGKVKPFSFNVFPAYSD